LRHKPYSLICFNVDLVLADMDEIRLTAGSDISGAFFTRYVELGSDRPHAADVCDGFVVIRAVRFGNAGNLACHGG
jgi:hypothetical protein